jgi:hypothetical protein
LLSRNYDEAQCVLKFIEPNEETDMDTIKRQIQVMQTA